VTAEDRRASADHPGVDHRLRNDDSGFALIEVVVSAALVVIMAVGVFAGLDGASHASGNLRGRSVASALAQQDQERMRALDPNALATQGAITTTKAEQGITYTIDSSTTWKNDPDAAPPCTGDSSSADYLQITSKVSWPNMAGQNPIQEDSLVSVPQNNTGGTVQVMVVDRDGNPETGITVALAGTRTASATTAAGGCVVWQHVPAGNNTVTISATNGVSPDGQPTDTEAVVVKNGSTAVVGPVAYDFAGRMTTATTTGATTSVWTKNCLPASTCTTYTANWDRITVKNAGMSAPRNFGTRSATWPAPAGPIVTTGGDNTTGSAGLYPFKTTQPYTTYAGDCAKSDPITQAPTPQPIDAFTVNRGVTSSSMIPPPSGSPVGTPWGIRMPYVDLTTSYVSAAFTPSSGPLGSVRVKITTTTPGCAAPAQVYGPYTSDTNGKLNTVMFPALPYGTYSICAEYTFAPGQFYTMTSAAGAAGVVPLTVNKQFGTSLNLVINGNQGTRPLCP
jgi:Tfp pilus assembly protein PilV